MGEEETDPVKEGEKEKKIAEKTEEEETKEVTKEEIEAPAAPTEAPTEAPAVTKLYSKALAKAKAWRPRRQAERATFGSLTTLGGVVAGCVLLAVAVGGFALGVRRQRVLTVNSDETELLDTENQAE